MEKVVVISGTSHYGLAKKTAKLLGNECYLPRVYRYATGDFEVVLPCNMRGRRVFIIQTFLPNLQKVCYHFLETIFLVNAAHKASAGEVSLIVPHLGWDQSDKKWTGRMPIAGELIAAFFHYAGMRRYIGVHLHTPQFQGFFPLPVIVDHLVADRILMEYVIEQEFNENAVLLPGDLGFSKTARKLAERINTPLIEVEKERVSGRKVIIHGIYGKVEAKRVIIWDDKIGEGTTVRAIVEELEKKGAKSVVVVATHALFGGTAKENLKHPLIQDIIVTDTLPHSFGIRRALPLTILSISSLLADAIREISIEGGSVSKLFEGSLVERRPS